MADFSEFDNPNFSGQYRKYASPKYDNIRTAVDYICWSMCDPFRSYS